MWRKGPSGCFLSLHAFWAFFPVGSSPLALSDVVRADSSLSFTYFPAALLRCATTSLQTVACRQTGTVHSELDGLSLSREEIETDYRITVLTISISLPPGNLATTYTDYYRQNMVVSSILMLSGKKTLTKDFILGIIFKCCTPKISHRSLFDRF